MNNEMDAAAVQAAYSRWARAYDWTFGKWFVSARRRAIELMRLRDGDRVIEVGVGTGLSLPLIEQRCRFIGVDFSRPMLEKALPRVRESSGGCRAALVEADGARLPFAAGVFDAGLAPFVVSAAPDPVGLLQDVIRVCRPGARVVVLNHFSPRTPLLAAVERGASAVTSRLLGFHADFPMEPLFERAEVSVDHVERVTRLGSWYAVTFTRRDD